MRPLGLREIKQKFALINRIINSTINSLQIESIDIKQENGTFHMPRTNNHIILIGRMGSQKTQILDTIAEQTQCGKPFAQISYPGMVGSIQDNEVILGSLVDVMQEKIPLLLMDEFNIATTRSSDEQVQGTDALLHLLEGQYHKRKISKACKEFRKGKKDGKFYFRAYNGTMEIKAKFAFIGGTMYHPNNSMNPKVKALFQRVIPVFIYPTEEETDAMLQGYNFFIYKHKEFTKEQKKVVIKKKDWNHILRFVKEQLKQKNINVQILPRLTNDLARIYATEGKHDKELYEFVCIAKGKIHYNTTKKKDKKDTKEEEGDDEQ